MKIRRLKLWKPTVCFDYQRRGTRSRCDELPRGAYTAPEAEHPEEYVLWLMLLLLCVCCCFDVHVDSNHMCCCVCLAASSQEDDTGVCEKNTPPDGKTGWKISFENTRSWAALQFLLLGRMAKAQVEEMFFHRHR